MVVPWGFLPIQATNFSTSGWDFRASSVLYSRSSSLLPRTVWICLWQGGQRPTVRWISCRSKTFLFFLFLWRVLGTRWWRVNRSTGRPHNSHSPPLAPLVLFTRVFYRRFGVRRVSTFSWKGSQDPVSECIETLSDKRLAGYERAGRNRAAGQMAFQETPSLHPSRGRSVFTGELFATWGARAPRKEAPK